MRLGVVCDFAEERWPSMDLVADMLLENLQAFPDIQPARIRPPMRPRFGSASFLADRLLNRFVDYPRFLRKNSDSDLFHIVDHSYAHLVHQLPPNRAIVTCHDLDTFRCLLAPAEEPRSLPFRAMTRRILTGLRRAAFVACDSLATQSELLAHGIVPLHKTAVVPLGVHPSCTPTPDATADRAAELHLGPPDPHSIDILHVGSTIARKRIDVLLRVFAAVHQSLPRTRLIRVGGPFTPPQRELAASLGIASAIVELPYLDRDVLAAIYRRAALVLQPSDREGFGLPVAEAMACGTCVVASDLPVLREIGGHAAAYCAPGDVPAWTTRVLEMLSERAGRPEARSVRVRDSMHQVGSMTWPNYATAMRGIYHRILLE